jgi:hypothetical protein
MEKETAYGLGTSTPYRGFVERLDQIKNQIAGAIAEAKHSGRVIAAYGSSVGCASLINQFELGPHLAFVVDDMPFKKKLIGPDYAIEILGREELLAQNPALVIVLAWRYAMPIKEKNQAYLARGGRFLIPLPEVTVLPSASAG